MSQEHQNYILSQTCLYAKQLYHQRLNNDQDARKFNYITIVDLYQAVKDLSKRIKIYVDVCDIGAIDLNQLNQNEVTEFDHHAFIQILDQMKPDSAMDNIHYKKWQNQVAKLKTIFHSIAPNKTIQNKWHKVSIISLFLRKFILAILTSSAFFITHVEIFNLTFCCVLLSRLQPKVNFYWTTGTVCTAAECIYFLCKSPLKFRLAGRFFKSIKGFCFSSCDCSKWDVFFLQGYIQ